MAKRTFWVVIETDEDILGDPAKPVKEDMYRIFRETGNYGIADFWDDEDVAEITFKTDK